MSSSPTLDAAAHEPLVGRRITVSGHFVGPITLDRVRAHDAVIEPLEEDPDVDVRPEWLSGS